MPITPVFEQPPVTRHTRQIDWQPTLDALAERPGEWAKVDGPFKAKTGSAAARSKSLKKFADLAGVDVDVTHRKVGDEQWLYARLVVEDQAEPEQPEAKTAEVRRLGSPTRAVPDPPRSPAMDDLGDDALTCDICGDRFRTNVRLRQHQANAHKAS